MVVRPSGPAAERERRGAIAGAPKTRGLTVAREEWRQAAEDMAADGGRLLALWASRDLDGDDRRARGVYRRPGVLVLSLPLRAPMPAIRASERWFPSANRMQRAVADLSGLPPTDADTRPWLRHAAWPENFHPLIDADAPPCRR